MVALKAPEIFFIPRAHVAPFPAQAVEHPNTILEPKLDSYAHPNRELAPNPTPNPAPDPTLTLTPSPNPNQD